ncbi:MAG: undecaprenyl-diphosphate phosphatase [Rhodospirillaceae bacterium]|nr:undecaprenyl-diphosphate phosphatase [Rhodospirillales bacterium]
MTFLDVVFVALIQGLAEVLPLGAAGHLALIPRLVASAEGRAAVVVAADVGIVAALMVYFWRDLFIMGRSVVKLAKGRVEPGARLLLQVLLGSLPALALTWGFSQLGGGTASPTTAAAALLVFGLFLLAADAMGVTVRRVEHLGWLGAAIIGILQAAAAIPGVSRTGITITAARLMGFERQDAARFSLLLAIPLIAGQAAMIVAQLSRQAPLIFSTDLMVAAGLAFILALIAVTAMMAWVDRHTFAPFAVWRIILGLGVLVWGLLP